MRRLCFYTCLSFCPYGGDLVPGGLVTGGVPVPGGVPGPGGWSGPGGVPGPKRGAWWRPPRTASVAGGTHPTGMHSCYSIRAIGPKIISDFKSFFMLFLKIQTFFGRDDIIL